MIEYHYETNVELENEVLYSDWITRIVVSEGFELGGICYVFCDDEYLLELNRRHLKHDTLTDIITFDYTENQTIAGDIFISYERVVDNALEYRVVIEEELKRVMTHGLLHMMGYNDKTKEEKRTMREKENEKMNMFHVEQ